MPIYVAYDYEGYPEDIVLARSKELADVYWQGKKIYAYSIREINEDNLIGHITGVLPILSTRETSVTRPGSYKEFKIRTVNKG